MVFVILAHSYHLIALKNIIELEYPDPNDEPD